jgi:hypothetical protein
VKRTGSGEGTFLADPQAMAASDGSTFRNEPLSAFVYKASDLGSETLAQGKEAEGYLVFDIPASARPVALEFIGALGADPVTIPLG